MRIRTAVIGCGAITKVFHLPSLLSDPTFELVALVDPDVDAARGLNREYGISVPVKNDIRDLPPIDAAVVAVPPHLHAEICIALLIKGVHVLCEKPMATSVAEGEAMVNAAKVGKAVLLIGMQKHYCPNTSLLKDILTDGMLGQIKRIRLVSAIRSQWDTANIHRFDPDHSKGGVLFEYGIHWISRMIYWFGAPKLNRYADDRIDGVEVNAIVETVYHADGQDLPGSMYFSWDHNLKDAITIVGENGTAEVQEKDDSAVFISKTISSKPLIMETRNGLRKEEVDLFGLQLEYFAECIHGRVQDPEPTALALEALRFIEECYANRTGVDQPWVFHGIDRRNNSMPPKLR